MQLTKNYYFVDFDFLFFNLLFKLKWFSKNSSAFLALSMIALFKANLKSFFHRFEFRRTGDLLKTTVLIFHLKKLTNVQLFLLISNVPILTYVCLDKFASKPKKRKNNYILLK